MRRLPGIAITVLGLLIVATGITMAVTSHAETWVGPVIIGGNIAFLGVVVAAIGWLVVRAR